MYWLCFITEVSVPFAPLKDAAFRFTTSGYLIFCIFSCCIQIERGITEISEKFLVSATAQEKMMQYTVA